MGAIGFISKNRIGKGINLNEFRQDILEHLNAIKVQTENKILVNKNLPLEKNARIQSRADFLVLAGSAGSLEPLEEIVKKIHCFDIPIIIAISATNTLKVQLLDLLDGKTEVTFTSREELDLVVDMFPNASLKEPITISPEVMVPVRQAGCASEYR